MDFLNWKLGDHRFQGILLEVARIIIDMYSAPLINCDDASKSLEKLSKTVEQEVALSAELKQLGG